MSRVLSLVCLLAVASLALLIGCEASYPLVVAHGHGYYPYKSPGHGYYGGYPYKYDNHGYDYKGYPGYGYHGYGAPYGYPAYGYGHGHAHW
ncbi:prisilkin-39-like [Schistocerca cancellata]|uniref:prisilkin-39-like n=1 Tax=Schistocerca cancellata TaxID=274614 RepID=UPI00211870FF|nr:prisilkin-39-like [Schistocerca cancellata]